MIPPPTQKSIQKGKRFERLLNKIAGKAMMSWLFNSF